MVQLKIFEVTILEHAELICESPKMAFWNIRLEHDCGTFYVIKESGSRGKILDRRTWKHEKYEAAKKDYDRRLRLKLNPERKSPRKYEVKDSIRRRNHKSRLEY